jgi:hypothetical protein
MRPVSTASSEEGSGPPKPFVVVHEAGAFTFHCLVHPGMKGRVLPKAPVPSVHSDRRRRSPKAADIKHASWRR